MCLRWILASLRLNERLSQKQQRAPCPSAGLSRDLLEGIKELVNLQTGLARRAPSLRHLPVAAGPGPAAGTWAFGCFPSAVLLVRFHPQVRVGRDGAAGAAGVPLGASLGGNQQRGSVSPFRAVCCALEV